jgi:hypothetical protein
MAHYKINKFIPKQNTGMWTISKLPSHGFLTLLGFFMTYLFWETSIDFECCSLLAV